MNPIIRAMLSRIAQGGASQIGRKTNLLGMLTQDPEASLMQVFPKDQDRLNDAFKQLGADRIAQAVASMPQPQSSMPPFMMAPPSPQASQGMSANPGNIVPTGEFMNPGADVSASGGAPGPLPAPGSPGVPASVPAPPAEALGFFKRNGFLQRDQDTGTFLNPMLAAMASR